MGIAHDSADSGAAQIVNS